MEKRLGAAAAEMEYGEEEGKSKEPSTQDPPFGHKTPISTGNGHF